MRTFPALALAAALVLAGCGGDDTAESTATDQMATDATATDATATEDMATEDMATDDAAAEDTATEDDGEAAAEGWTADDALQLTATRPDGSPLAVADLAGQPVFVETFATWCSNCRQQLVATQEAAATAGDQAAFLALSVEDDLDPAALDDYAAEHGFTDVTFAVLDAASLTLLQDHFGPSVLVPPSTPKFTITPDGTPGELVLGPESVDEILAQL